MTIQNKQNSDGSTNVSKSNIGYWAIISLIAIVVLLVGAYVIYINANPSTNTWVGAWKYLESETFRTLLPSVAVPILLFIFGVYDKTVKETQARREQQEERKLQAIKEEEERKERRLKMEEELKEKQLQAAEKTRDMLKQINSLVSEVRFFDGTTKMNDTLIRIASLSISVSEVTNIWKLRFPILPRSVHSLFVDYVVVLYWGAWARSPIYLQ